MEPAGESVRVRVPATSANLGPGFDALGLALDLYDEVSAEVLPEPGALEIEVVGEGAAADGRGGQGVPRDVTHLVYQAMVAGFAALAVPTPGLRITCHNAVPHGRGLGSSAAAIVSGLALARGLSALDAAWSDQALFVEAARIEGHPDNVAPAVFGGFTVAFARHEEYAAVRLPIHPDVALHALVPPTPVSTSVARGLLPPQVPHADAAYNAGRAALLVAAVTAAPQHLFDATEDRLHQRYRAPALGETTEVIARLRERGLAAVVSGAGPTVLVMSSRAKGVGAGGSSLAEQVAEMIPEGWRSLVVAPGEGVRRIA